MEKAADDSDIAFSVLTYVLSSAAIIINLLIIAVIVASEKVARNVACLLFLCISHLQLAALSLIHISVDHTHSDYSGVVHLHYSTPSVHSAVSPTNSTSNTSAAELYSSHREAAAVQSSDEGMDSDVMSCTAQIILECFENSATLWAVFGIAGMTLHQYIYIEWPFWYGIKVTTKRLIIYNILGGVTSHLIGMVPLMSNFAAKQKCSGSDILLLGTGYSISYAVIILLLFSAVAAMSVRMVILAESHKRKMKEYNNIETASRRDSLKFILILITTFFISVIVPEASKLINDLYTGIAIPHSKINTLRLIAPIVYAVFYSNRTPNGFIGSVRLAICCCLPVKSKQPEMQVSGAVRFAMMRLGHVMIKIDEQAARRRHSSFMRSKQRINRLLHSSVSSNMSCEGNLHKPVRPYNSHIPTMWRLHRKSIDSDVGINNHVKAHKSKSVDITNKDGHQKKSPATSLFPWLPRSCARNTLDVTQAIQISVVGDGETHPVHHLTVNSPQSTTGLYLTLNNNSEYDKLSLISERSASGERSVVCSPDVEHKPLVIERQVSQVSQQSEGEVNVAASLTECDLKNRTESEA